MRFHYKRFGKFQIGSLRTRKIRKQKSHPWETKARKSTRVNMFQDGSCISIQWRAYRSQRCVLIAESLRLALALFTAQMESSIVSTSVLAITNQLKGFEKSGWIFTSYLVTYTGKLDSLITHFINEPELIFCIGLIIIWAKLSDICGRKPLLLAAIFMFIVFSGACGASQTLIQL